MQNRKYSCSIHLSTISSSDANGHGRYTVLPFRQDSQILIDLGSRLRDLRVSHGYSQIELAKKAAVSRATIQSLEKSGRISLSSLLRVLRVLDEHHALENIAPAQDFDPQAVFEREQNKDQRPSRKRVSKKGRAS
jgi:DNA-binding XRE family transcriptional regulator